MKRFARMAAAGALSLGMVGVFALPAYATFETEGRPDGAPAQRLVTAEIGDQALALDGVTAEFVAPAEAPRTEQAAGQSDQQKRAAQQTSEALASAQGQGLVAAAIAQLGVNQDCTALVENALRVGLGIPVGDLGTLTGHYSQFGYVVTDGSYAPGDILVWPGRHVAIYIGNGQAVHGGYGGNQTVIASAFIDGTPGAVVRIG